MFEYLKKGEIAEGDIVTLDGGFTCRKAGKAKIYSSQEDLWFACNEGRHFIVGQLNENNEYVGITV